MINQQQIQEQLQKPAQASSKARSKGKILKVKQPQKALENAVSGESLANYEAILNDFAAMGIDSANAEPRMNVFMLNTWKALGRVVKKGQHGVKIVTTITCTKKHRETGEEVAVKKVKDTTVFRISQTEAIDTNPSASPVAALADQRVELCED
jgi:hypothetical protein